MQLKVFILPIKDFAGAEAEMNGFLRSHRVLTVRTEFVSDGGNSFWIINICEPILDRAAVYDSYACRKGKGRLAAIDRAQRFSRQHDWFLKMDVRKYFDSIGHERLCCLLLRKFKDRRLLAVLNQIINSYETAPGRGVPIGNLSSQHFANFYLDPLDRFIKESLRQRAYVRYMDDFVVWGNFKDELKRIHERIRQFLAYELNLELKPGILVNRIVGGMDFLGYRIHPNVLRLTRRSKMRFSRKYHAYVSRYAKGHWDEATLQQRVQSLFAFVLHAESRGFRMHVMNRFGVAVK